MAGELTPLEELMRVIGLEDAGTESQQGVSERARRIQGAPRPIPRMGSGAPTTPPSVDPKFHSTATRVPGVAKGSELIAKGAASTVPKSLLSRAGGAMFGGPLGMLAAFSTLPGFNASNASSILGEAPLTEEQLRMARDIRAREGLGEPVVDPNGQSLAIEPFDPNGQSTLPLKPEVAAPGGPSFDDRVEAILARFGSGEPVDHSASNALRGQIETLMKDIQLGNDRTFEQGQSTRLDRFAALLAKAGEGASLAIRRGGGREVEFGEALGAAGSAGLQGVLDVKEKDKLRADRHQIRQQNLALNKIQLQATATEFAMKETAQAIAIRRNKTAEYLAAVKAVTAQDANSLTTATALSLIEMRMSTTALNTLKIQEKLNPSMHIPLKIGNEEFVLATIPAKAKLATQAMISVMLYGVNANFKKAMRAEAVRQLREAEFSINSAAAENPQEVEDLIEDRMAELMMQHFQSEQGRADAVAASDATFANTITNSQPLGSTASPFGVLGQ